MILTRTSEDRRARESFIPWIITIDYVGIKCIAYRIEHNPILIVEIFLFSEYGAHSHISRSRKLPDQTFGVMSGGTRKKLEKKSLTRVLAKFPHTDVDYCTAFFFSAAYIVGSITSLIFENVLLHTSTLLGESRLHSLPSMLISDCTLDHHLGMWPVGH